MNHPHVKDLSHFSNTEIEDRIVDLQRKYFQTTNVGVQAQIASILDMHKEELATRRAIEAQRQQDQESNENGLDNLINIS